MRYDFPRDITSYEADIKRCLALGFRFLRFPDKLERIFQEYDTEKRRQRYVFLGVCAVVLYNLYCIGDKVMLPDIYLDAWRVRMFIVSPVMIFATVLINFKPFQHFQEYLADVFVISASVGVIYILLLSNHPNVEHYHTGVLVIIMFGNIAARLRFTHAFVSSLVVFILYMHFARSVDQMSVETINNSGLIMLTTIIISLVANYQMEKESRNEYLLTAMHSITAEKLKETNKQLEYLSISDSLTGLSNRRFFDETIETEWKAAIRSDYDVSLIFLDIDCFKAYNDNYGHHAGDLCLREIGSVIQESVKRPRDLSARFGGEEFVVLLPRTYQQDAVKIADKIRKTVEWLEIEHKFSDVEKFVTVSIGVATLKPSPENSADDLLKLADSGMYQAKENGRNRVCVYQEQRAAVS